MGNMAKMLENPEMARMLQDPQMMRLANLEQFDKLIRDADMARMIKMPECAKLLAMPEFARLENVAAGYLDPMLPAGGGLANVFPFIVMILVLTIRPYGLFGQVRIERI